MSPTIIVIDTPSLGDRSYLVHDGRVGFVVDPQRDTDRVLAAAADAGIRITHVLETHIHNDYVTGGYALAQQTGAEYLVNADDVVSFDRVPVRDVDLIDVSPTLQVRAIHTPGHTFTHLSYALEGPEPVVFSGGSLLYGSTGRPDLLGASHTHELAHHQYASAHRLAHELPDETQVMLTHGFGSFCSATTTTASVLKNPALAAAFAGADSFGIEVFEPETTNALIAALWVHDLRCSDAAANPARVLAHPFELFMENACHGGLWRGAYRPRTALPFAAALGWVRARGGAKSQPS